MPKSMREIVLDNAFSYAEEFHRYQRLRKENGGLGTNADAQEAKQRMESHLNVMNRAFDILDRLVHCRECKERDNETNPAQYGLCMEHYDEYWPPARFRRPEGETQ